MMSWFSKCSLQLCQPEQQCLLHMSGSGPSCNLRLITAGEAKSRNGTQHLPAALNYFSTTGFPFLSLSVALLVSAASLFVFDLSLSCLIPSLLISLNLNTLFSPSASPFISQCLFLALSLSLSLSPFVLSQHSLGSAVGFEASFIEFTQVPRKDYLPIRSWWGIPSLWANPQISLKPSGVCVFMWSCLFIICVHFF